MKLASFVVAVDALLICAAAATGDLHPIVEVQSRLPLWRG
jgi:hypothetical protein